MRGAQNFVTVWSMCMRFVDDSAGPAVQGFLEVPAQANGDGIALAHGAGGNCQAKLLIELSEALGACGFTVLRFDLPFRVVRPTGPPRPGGAQRDRAGIRRAGELLKAKIPGRLFIGGHSYGGRQASMLAAEEPGEIAGLLLLSYPLHPPKKPTEQRTQHFPEWSRPAFFAHGTRDPFGSIAEMQTALKMIRVARMLLPVEGAGHDLLLKKASSSVPRQIAEAFAVFTRVP
jgi:predicted alpha/beta-hydrolase family hydrolase